MAYYLNFQAFGWGKRWAHQRLETHACICVALAPVAIVSRTSRDVSCTNASLQQVHGRSRGTFSSRPTSRRATRFSSRQSHGVGGSIDLAEKQLHKMVKFAPSSVADDGPGQGHASLITLVFQSAFPVTTENCPPAPAQVSIWPLSCFASIFWAISASSSVPRPSWPSEPKPVE